MLTFSNLGAKNWGRLGNQLFQIAATLGIAHRNGQMAVFPPWPYSSYFAQPLPEGKLPDCKRYRVNSVWFKDIKLPAGNWDLEGFFQSEKYFLDIEPEIRRLFTPAPHVVDYINQRYGALLAGTTCSLHVRRGDYLNQVVAFPSQPVAYYQHAIEQFPTGTQFLVFSDDPEWCKSQFSGSQFVFIENEEDIIDLLLMSRCQHHIIANSSFSWWGAWLNPNPEKIVFCPARWFGPAVSMRPKRYARDLYARGFRPLSLPGEHELSIQARYVITNPFYKIYFGFFKARSILWETKLIRSLRKRIKSLRSRPE